MRRTSLLRAFYAPLTSVDDVGVAQGVVLLCFAVEAHGLDEALRVVLAVGSDGEGLAVRQMEHSLVEEWGGNLILARSWVHRIEAQGGEHIPCGHLTTVVVARDACRCVVV